MKVYVVRHCATECSEKKIYCGRTDVPLSPRGKEEAERLQAVAEGYSFDVVLCSPLTRAQKTAEAVVGARKIPVVLDERLTERDFGDFEGTDAEGAAGKACRYAFAVKYPNGESNLRLAARVYAFLDEVKERYAGKSVCIVSHGSTCRIIRTYFKDMTDEEFYAYSHPTGTIEEYEW